MFAGPAAAGPAAGEQSEGLGGAARPAEGAAFFRDPDQARPSDRYGPVLTREQERELAPSQVSIRWERGRLILHADLDGADGALLEQALREAKDAAFTAGDPHATYTTALVEIASRSLASIQTPARAAHYRVYVHLDTEGAWINARDRLAHHLATRLGCTAATAPIWHTHGRPVSVATTQQSIPAATRRLVEDRDRGCAYPRCTATRFVEIHHVKHRQDGGGHDYDNLVCLCPHHHDAHHAGKFQITPAGNPLQPFTFTHRSGRPIHATPPEPDAGNNPREATIVTLPTAYAPPLGEHLDTNWVTFHRNE